MELNKLLHQYLNDSRNPDICFRLGWEYEKIGQTASACGFYLRATEFGYDTELQYEALLRMALCFEKQGSRWFMVKGLIMRAISLLPKRPEGHYLLARAYERNKEWQEGYTAGVLGMEFEYEEAGMTITDLEYPGKWVFEFQKGVCAWWIGLFDESMYIFRKLKKNPHINELHKQAVLNNLNQLDRNWVEPMQYRKEDFNKLRYKFDGGHLVEKNYSQCYQDLFVLMATDGMEYGSWIEIGCADPLYGNNTKLLEEWNWDGVSIDIDADVVEKWKVRKTIPYQMDATKIDWNKMPIWDLHNVTDYLQIDVDPPHISYEVLLQIPFWKHRFRVITFEHDFYMDESVKEKSRKYLKSYGYELVVPDVCVNDYDSYEDWWVHPELVNPKIIELLRSKTEKNPAKRYIFNND